MQDKEAKLKLKQEAKDLILKGCYKMAMNKLLRLIKMGADGLTRREWAVVHLNLGICLQFQDRLEEALDKVNEAIEIDALYEKPYYRKLQLLEELGLFQQALNSVPAIIKNKQIDELQEKIKENFQQSLGLERLRNKLDSKQFVQKLGQENLDKFVKETHEKIFYRIRSSEYESENIGEQLGIHYAYLQQFEGQALESFLHGVYQLMVEHPGKKIDEFWGRYLENIGNLLPIEQKMLPHLPIARIEFSSIFKILNKVIEWCSPAHICQFLAINKPYIQSSQLHKQVADNLANYIHISGQKLNTLLNNYKIQEYLQQSMVIDSLLDLYYQHSPTEQNVTDFTSAYALKYKKMHMKSFSNPRQEQQLLTLMMKKVEDFSFLYVFDQVVGYLSRELIQPLHEELMTVVRQVKQNKIHMMMYYIVGFEVDPVKKLLHGEETNLYPVIESLTYANSPSTQDIVIRFILLMCVNDPSHLLQLLSNLKALRPIIKSMLQRENILLSVQAVNSCTRILYLCVEDMEESQEKMMANKLGVKVSDVHHARKLQGELLNENAQKEIAVARNKAKLELVEEWIAELSILIQKLSICEESHLVQMLLKVLVLLSEVYPGKLCHSVMIEFMLRHFKGEKGEPVLVSTYFKNITKKGNPDVFQYKHLQAMCECLMWGAENNDHELAIFESLLGLVGLSSRGVRLELSRIVQFLYQENEYITHAALELVNNILINPQLEQSEQMMKKTINIVFKYYHYYRGIVQEPIQSPPLTDYSHPYKVLATILCIFIIAKHTAGVPELESWAEAEKTLMKMNAGSIELLVFGLVVFWGDKLPPGWSKGLQNHLQTLSQKYPDKWLKIKPYGE